MTQTTLTAEAQTANTSATVTIPSGASYAFGLFTTNAAGIPAGVACRINVITPGNVRHLANLTGAGAPFDVVGPLEVQVVRPDISAFATNVGVFYES